MKVVTVVSSSNFCDVLCGLCLHCVLMIQTTSTVTVCTVSSHYSFGQHELFIRLMEFILAARKKSVWSVIKRQFEKAERVMNEVDE